jgi:hypothetical protein
MIEPACWSVFNEVLASEYVDALLFARPMGRTLLGGPKEAW